MSFGNINRGGLEKNNQKELQLKQIGDCKKIFEDFFGRALEDERFWERSPSEHFNPRTEFDKLPFVALKNWKVAVQYDILSSSEWWDVKRIIIFSPEQKIRLDVEFSVLGKMLYLNDSRNPLISLEPEYWMWFMPRDDYETVMNIGENERMTVLNKILGITQELEDFFANEKATEENMFHEKTLQKEVEVKNSIDQLLRL